MKNFFVIYDNVKTVNLKEQIFTFFASIQSLIMIVAMDNKFNRMATISAF